MARRHDGHPWHLCNNMLRLQVSIPSLTSLIIAQIEDEQKIQQLQLHDEACTTHIIDQNLFFEIWYHNT